jgi:hypothetical protein
MFSSRLNFATALLSVATAAFAQPGVLTRELLIRYTPDWKGERFPDGRPKVPDGILQRMKSVTWRRRGRSCVPPASTTSTRTAGW